MIRAAEWARTGKVPFFGICLGMHIMVIEWCRGVLGWENADSTEFNPDTTYPVVSLPKEQGTMRLGLGELAAEPESHVFAAYRAPSMDKVHFWERHRHRYEVSGKYRAGITGSGLIIAALAPDSSKGGDSRVEAVEWPDHPWGVGVQFRPEFKSKPTAAAPLFRDFIAAAKKRNNEQ
jgi:CTP synthase